MAGEESTSVTITLLASASLWLNNFRCSVTCTRSPCSCTPLISKYPENSRPLPFAVAATVASIKAVSRVHTAHAREGRCDCISILLDRLVPQFIARQCQPRSAQPFLGEEHFFDLILLGPKN